ncbi:1,4-alpha-glucan branching protein GlgB [Parapedobacter sp. SGR-10]|uniref:1,4-alpha-glucan branching protein GlgB n=1 Tax=Parapedobacter sp. SGR-10 TaxID=2710879 RepID=UPI0013D192F9|nr:1,4-alpha-glucan branching protein GlgB [Parapedobacter sp. SGR-10]NGF56569.1 1,4-alpha-glucan branching protein GlgB [Parapedobacter sp. SGR-10]
MSVTVEVFSLLTDFDIGLFKAGRHYRLYEKLGSQTVFINGRQGVYFAVWAPNAQSVSVIGNFNGWNPHSHQLFVRWDESGIWEGVVYDIHIGEVYKYHITTHQGEKLEKGDPFALVAELPPKTASIVGTTWYKWGDERWMRDRKERNRLDRPFSVYEMHIGSWMRDPNHPERFLSYREIADKLVPYIKNMGFTHVEFMPLMEHPYYPSWGYQITGYFAASARYGGPQDLMFLIDQLHKNDIGVILDWVPSHFPGDAHGLWRFDGSALYEHEDPRKGFHPDWKSYIFNYGRNEVRSFLISNALFWLDRYHIDGLRVDAVASMLYLDYSRNEGEWIPNEFGGRENLEAVAFLKEFNEAVYANYPDVQTIAEESTSWPGVSKPTYDNGLGFGMKWMMGWMHDTLDYFSEDPIHRKYHHDRLTFATVYAYHEHFMLPLSHDEVVYGKQSLIYKMPGDEWQKFANLRALYLYMFTFSGTKLLFMGGEFGQTSEWNVNQSLDWHLLDYTPHRGMQQFVKQLNHLYKAEPALYEKAFSEAGFEWLEYGDRDRSVFAYIRKGHDRHNDLVVVLNLTPVVWEDYRLGVPASGNWEVIFNSDEEGFYGSGIDSRNAKSEALPWMGRAHSIVVSLPPLGGLVLKLTQ